MRSGIRDLLSPSANVPEIRDAIDRASQAATGRRRVLRPVNETERYTGRVITIASPKGGVGKTTVSTNLAIGLTAAAPQSTVLVDLDVQFGDCASALGPGARVHAARRRPRPGQRGHDGPQDLPHPAPERALRRLRCGVAGGRRHGPRRGRHPAAGLLAREFRYVVVDTAPGLSEQTLAALDRATDVVMLTSMDVPGVRGLRKELDVLRELCMIPAGPARGHELRRPEGRAVGARRRDDDRHRRGRRPPALRRRVPASTNQGVPLLQSGGKRDPMVKELRRLVSRFAATPLMQPGRYRAKHRAAS